MTRVFLIKWTVKNKGIYKMVLADISIHRPVLATVMSLMIILIGIIGYQRLSVREYPKIDAPVVSVRTVYTGASAEIIESQITKPLENSLAGIEGIRLIKSVSREEVSQITVEFVLERNVDAAANDVRDRVSRVRGLLPKDSKEPVVAKIEADAQAIIWLALSSDVHDALEITDYADRYIVSRLQTLTGVASVIIGGERRYAMRIWLDRERLAAYSLTPQDVENALQKQNVDIPSGRIESLQREFTVFAETDLKSADQFDNLIIKQINGYSVRLKDIGSAQLGPLDERNILRFMSNPAVGLGIVKQSNANTLEVAQAVKKELPNIEKTLPKGMKIQVAFDTSVFVEKSIEAVYKTMLEALGLVILVIFLFLRNVRATLIPFVTIPVSLIGSFIFLYAFNFSINVLTLLGLVLAIGLVVDDAIVMLENIHRHIEEGMKPFQAAVSGAKEIGFAVLAMTFTLAAVFLPLTFIPGNTGRLFVEFAITVAAAVLVSGFVALTLTPMMCSKLLKHQEHHNWLYRVTEKGLNGLNNGYRWLLTNALKIRWIMLFIFLGTGYSSWWLFTHLKTELAPLEDRGNVVGMVIAPEGATLEYTNNYARKIEEFYNAIPEMSSSFMVVAPGLEKPNPVNSAIAFLRLVAWDKRSRSQQEIVKNLFPKLAGLTGVLAFAINPPSLGQSFRSTPLQFIVQGNSYQQLEEVTSKMLNKMRENKQLFMPDSDLKLNKPQLKVEIDRDKASALGVQIEDIGRTLETLLGGRQVTRFKKEGEQYDVIVKLKDQDRTKPADLTSIFIRNKTGQLFQLSNLVKIKEAVAPKELNHFNRLRAVILSSNLAPNYTLGEAVAYMEEIAKEILPTTMQTALDGQSRELKESGQALYATFVLALIFIYLVLAAQFESFKSPLIILFTVPLALTGALLALQLAGQTLNVYSQIGLVMLVGLITKHGILIVEFANQLQAKGMNIYDAVTEASTLRLRPILMTTAAMVLGALPLAMANGAGAESRWPIGWVIVGGLTLGTILTLFIIPSVYTFLGKRKIPQNIEEDHVVMH
jgi:multidrug efflux pump